MSDAIGTQTILQMADGDFRAPEWNRIVLFDSKEGDK